jgi:hypothetical protein
MAPNRRTVRDQSHQHLRPVVGCLLGIAAAELRAPARVQSGGPAERLELT